MASNTLVALGSSTGVVLLALMVNIVLVFRNEGELRLPWLFTLASSTVSFLATTAGLIFAIVYPNLEVKNAIIETLVLASGMLFTVRPFCYLICISS